MSRVPATPGGLSGGLRRQPILPGGLILVALMAGTALGLGLLLPPTERFANQPADRFAAERAIQHVRALAVQPRPVGSPAHTLVRAYLQDQLAALGLAVEVSTAPALVPLDGTTNAVTLRNLVARIPGTGTARGAVALMAHYDSVPWGYGAADNAAGVAAVLEVARALRASPPLPRDVLLVLTDGEEHGLLGARALVETSLASQIEAIVNVEAVGVRGPSLLFETSADNAALIQAFAGAPQPVGFSFAPALYQAMADALAYDTDLTPFLERGVPGLNLAFVYDRAAYHTSADNLAALDPRSLQHHGDTLLALARGLASQPDNAPRGPTVFFTILPGVLARYPASWAPVLALLALLGGGATLVRALWRRQLSLRGLGWGFLAALAAPLAAALSGSLIWWLVGVVRGARVPDAGRPAGHLALFGLVTLAMGMVLGVRALLRARTSPHERVGGALAVWALLALASALWVPGASYLFLWPLVAALAAIALLPHQPRAGMARWRLAVLALLALPVLILTVPVIYLLFQVLGLSLPGTPAVPAAGAWLLLASLVMVLLAPQIEVLSSTRRRVVSATMAIGAGLLSLALLLPPAARPVALGPVPGPSASYRLDADQGRASWTTPPENVPGWVRDLLGASAAVEPIQASFPPRTGTWLRADAAALTLPAPEVQVLSDRWAGERRILRLRVGSARAAPLLRLYLPPDTGLERLEIDGLEIPRAVLTQYATPGDWLWLPILDPPPAGVEVQVELASSAPLSLYVDDRTPGPPAGMALPPGADPALIATSVARLVELGP